MEHSPNTTSCASLNYFIRVSLPLVNDEVHELDNVDDEQNAEEYEEDQGYLSETKPLHQCP